MCGRYTARFTDTTRLPMELAEVVTGFPPRYNIAPQQTAPVIRRLDGKSVFEELRWGFRPAWMQDRNKAQINARAETLFEKPMFKHSALNRRCLVLASGWFEWQQTPGGKQPFAFRLKDDALFAFAGIWTSWHGENEAQEDSYAIITAVASLFTAPIHNRMPVILDQKKCEAWLDTRDSDAKHLVTLLESYQDNDLEYYPVSFHVNSPKNTDASCLTLLDQHQLEKS